MTTYTPNKGYGYPAHGAEVNNWDAFLNAIFVNVDLNVGGTNTTVCSTATTGVTLAQGDSGTAQYMQQRLTGTLGSNIQLVFPSTDAGGAFGGFWIVSNETSGSFSVTAITTSSTNGGVVIPSGGRSLIVSDGTNVNFADNNATAKLYTYLGNPSNAVAGTAGATNGSATTVIWDGTNRQLYVAATTGGSTSTMYTAVGTLPTPQGYFTAVSNTPVITSNQTVGTIFYTPDQGAWTVVASSNGNSMFPYQFTQISYSLSPLAASTIYDCYIAYLSSVGIFGGFSPSWAIGGGSISAGSAARGTGAGSAQITRSNLGPWVNTNAMNLVNGSNTYSVGAGAAICLGSILTASAAAVTCHTGYGQSRQWGISNIYNRKNVSLRVGDATASWSISAGSGVQSTNTSSLNVALPFSCLQEEVIRAEIGQQTSALGTGGGIRTGVGLNVTNAYTGYAGQVVQANTTAYPWYGFATGNATISPVLGFTNIYMLQQNAGTTTTTATGGENNCLMTVTYRA